MEQARRLLLSRLGTFASLEMPTSEKTFSLAETHGLSPTEADFTFRVAMGELASVEQHCLTSSMANFGNFNYYIIIIQLCSQHWSTTTRN